jgi:erythromycin esterase
MMPSRLKLAAAWAVAVLLAMWPSGLRGQGVPRDEYLGWARDNARPITVTGQPEGPESWEPLRAIVGDARVVALGEPLHGFHGPLALRNQVVQYLVKEFGFTAVALETGLSPSKRLHDYVTGRAQESDASLARAFSYGFGNFEENLELLRWMRSFNAIQPSGRSVRIYGIDVTGDALPNTPQALGPVFAYLDRVDPGLAVSIRKEFDGLESKCGREVYLKLPREEKDRITAWIGDLVASLRRGRSAYTAASSRDDYDWALRQAINAAQGDAQARSTPEDLFRQMQTLEVKPTVVDGVNMREVAIADNLDWVLDRERPRGRVLLFAHNSHIQRHAEFANADKRAAPLSRLAPRINPAGLYLDSLLGREMVVIGVYFGTVEGLPEGKATLRTDPDGIEALMGSHGLPAYAIDLRSLPNNGRLSDWMRAGQPARGGIFGEQTHRLAPARSFDAVIYMQRVSPTSFTRTLSDSRIRVEDDKRIGDHRTAK